MRTRARWVVLLLVAVLLASACGSRLPDQTLEAIDADLTGGGGGGGGRGGGTAGGGTNFAAGETAPTDGATTEVAAPVEGGGPAPEAGPAPAEGEAPAGPAAPGAPAAAAAPGQPCRPGTATSPGVTPREIKTAAIVTDSGPLPGATEGAYRAAAAYFAKVNSEGGVCGRKLTLVKGDDGLDPARGRGEFLRLEPQVLSFVGNFSVADSGYVDLIQKTNVPFVGLSVDPSGRQLPTVFPKGNDDRLSTGPYVWWKQQHPDVTKAAILYADVGGVGSNIDGTARAVEKAGFKLVEPPIAVGVADPDYTGQVRNLQDKGVEFVYLFAFEVNMHVRFNRNMRQQGYEPKIKGSNIAFNDRFSKLLKTEGDGWENNLAYLPFLDPAEKAKSPAVNDFVTWNQRVFPGGQLDLFNISGWGRAVLFVEALRIAGPDPNREKLLAALRQIQRFDGGGMEVPLNNQNGQLEGPCFAMARHEGGTWKRLHPAQGYDCKTGEVFKYK